MIKDEAVVLARIAIKSAMYDLQVTMRDDKGYRRTEEFDNLRAALQFLGAISDD